MDMPRLPRRSADARRRRHAGRQAPGDQGRADADEDSGAADLVRRRAAAAGRARPARSRPTAGAAALPITYRFGPGRRTVHLKLAFNWDHQAALRRHRPDARLDRTRTSGSSAATTTTPGSTAPTIRSAASSAELEEARALGELRKQGWRAEADDRLRRLGRRGAGAARIDRMGRRRTRAELAGSTPWPTSTPTATGAASSTWAARTRSSSSSTTWRATSPIPRRTDQRVEAAAGGAHRDAHGRASAQEARTRGDLRIGALGSGSDFTPFLQHAGVAVAQPRLRRRGRQRHLPLDLRRLLLVHALPRHATSSTGARWRRPSARRSCGWPTPMCCRSTSRDLADTVPGAT